MKAAYYHAGLEKEDRLKVQSDWAEGRIHTIVATIAFGMGIIFSSLLILFNMVYIKVLISQMYVM
jgi:superfamily II helicase